MRTMGLQWGMCSGRGARSRATGPLLGASMFTVVCLVFGDAAAAGPEDEPRMPRSRDQEWTDVLAGPYQSPRIFTVPTAEVLGAWQMSGAWDASLLTEHGALSTTSVYAIGFGDFAQLEYRSEAVNTTSDPVPIELFAAGVQFLAPLPQRVGWPSLAAALRLGFPVRDQTTEGSETFTHEERITDAYVVASWQLWGALDAIELHLGARIGEARITSLDVDETERTLIVLPAGGVEVTTAPRAWLAAEFGAVPEFDPGTASRPGIIRSRPFGRAGVRWAIWGPVFLEASVGYRIETRRAFTEPSGVRNLVAWDMRTGLEVFLPWGAIACKSTGIFCESPAESLSLDEGVTDAF